MRHVSFGLCGLTAEATDITRAGYGAAIKRTIDTVVLAEEVGFDSVWLSEHHFALDGYLPSPFGLLGALAVETERVILGPSVILAPLHDPLRLAEECAIIDQLSAGRFVLGMGLGYRTEEWKAFGVEPRHRLRVLLDCISTCRRAWSGEPVGGLGLLDDEWTVDVRPLPVTDPGPPIWLGSGVEAGVRRAGRLADGFIAPPVTPAYFDTCMQWLADEGALERSAVMTSVFGFLAASNAREVARPAVRLVDDQYRRWRAMETGTVMPTARARDGEAEMIDAADFVLGNPEEMTAALRPWYELLRSLPGDSPAHLTIRLTWPGMGEEMEEAIRLFGREVIPALRA